MFLLFCLLCSILEERTNYYTIRMSLGLRHLSYSKVAFDEVETENNNNNKMMIIILTYYYYY